jgi:hypothetical protein
MPFDLAQIGFTTTVLESVASSIAAGMLMSSFAMAGIGFVRGWTRRDIEATALRNACEGGFFAVGLLAFDLLARYIV